MTSHCPIERLDTRYASFRLKDKRRENTLLSSILEEGIQNPLFVISRPDSEKLIILDGHKRFRSARRLNLSDVPIIILGENIPSSLLKFLRLNDSSGLSALEEASFLDALHGEYGLSVSEIARRLEKSPAWVSVRLGMLSELSNTAKTQIFSGRFPVRSYMYSLRPFTRGKNKGTRENADNFIQSVAGNNLSARDIDILAKEYFKGDSLIKAQIQQGNLDWTLRQLKNGERERMVERDNAPSPESALLSNINIISACIHKVRNVMDKDLFNHSFNKRTVRMVSGLLNLLDTFKIDLETLYARLGQTTSGESPVSGGKT